MANVQRSKELILAKVGGQLARTSEKDLKL